MILSEMLFLTYPLSASPRSPGNNLLRRPDNSNIFTSETAGTPPENHKILPDAI